MKLFCEHAVALPADRFWEILHDPLYEARVAAAVGLEVYEELERREERDALYRRIRVEANLPDPLRSLLRRIAGIDSARYVEEQWRSCTRREVRWRMTPGVLADRIRVEGVVRVEPRSARRCARLLDGAVEVRILGVGGLVERAAVSLVTEAYAKGAALAPEAEAEISAARAVADAR